MTFWANPMDFANLTVKSTPVGADVILIADSASTPVGQPKQVTITSLPISAVIAIAYSYMLR